MKTAVAIIVKFFVTLAIAWISFMLFGTASFWTVLTIAAAATLLNYLIGDLLVLSRFGNIIASIVNGVIGGALAWIVLLYSPVTYYYMTSVYIFAVIVAVAEFFFHMYLISAHIVDRKKADADLYSNKISYNTETGSELYPYANKNMDRGYDGTLNSGYNKSINQSDSDKNNKDM